MTDLPLNVPRRVIALRKTFVTTPTFTLLRTEFERLLALRQAEIAAGIVGEARSIAVIGASGSGKSTLVARLLSTTPGLVVDDADGRCDVISLRIPSPATLKSVGRAILEALGFPLKRERTADAIWEMVRAFLQERRVLFLHLDEAQDIAGHQTEREKQAVINTLKTLMQHRHWPVGLILSGMPSLQETLNMDGQLARRVTPIGIPRLSPLVDTPLVTHMLEFYTREAGVACPSGGAAQGPGPAPRPRRRPRVRPADRDHHRRASGGDAGRGGSAVDRALRDRLRATVRLHRRAQPLRGRRLRPARSPQAAGAGRADPRPLVRRGMRKRSR